MATALELRTQRARIWEQMKALNDASESENRDLTQEERDNWTKAEKDLDSLDDRIARQMVMESTPAGDGDLRSSGANTGENRGARTQREVRQTPEYRSAFENWVKFGMAGLEPEQRSMISANFAPIGEGRAMQTNQAAAGGVFIPEGFVASIEEAMLYYGGMREAATVIQTDSGNDLPWPNANDTTVSGRLLSEGVALTATDVAVGNQTLKAYVYSSDLVLVSLQLLQDSAFDVQSWLSGVLATRIGRITNNHFTLGSGANQPTGLMLGTTQGKAGATGQTTTVTADDLIDLEYSVDIAYRKSPKAAFMMTDGTVKVIRKQKDGDGQYLWQPGLQTGQPNTINGYRYFVNNDMPTMAASTNSVAFGDFSKYIIRDVRGVQVIRLDERYAEYLQVGFFAFSRTDGVLINAGGNPIKHYTNSAT